MFSYRWKGVSATLYILLLLFGGCGRSEPERLEYPARIPAAAGEQNTSPDALEAANGKARGVKSSLVVKRPFSIQRPMRLVSRRPALSAWTSYFSLSATLSLTRTGSQHHRPPPPRRARTSLPRSCAGCHFKDRAYGRPPEFDGEMPTGFLIRLSMQVRTCIMHRFLKRTTGAVSGRCRRERGGRRADPDSV